MKIKKEQHNIIIHRKKIKSSQIKLQKRNFHKNTQKSLHEKNR